VWISGGLTNFLDQQLWPADKTGGVLAIILPLGAKLACILQYLE
jgi:hypothetical protein